MAQLPASPVAGICGPSRWLLSLPPRILLLAEKAGWDLSKLLGLHHPRLCQGIRREVWLHLKPRRSSGRTYFNMLLKLSDVRLCVSGGHVFLVVCYAIC